jgi:hypothetical protein
VKELRNIKRMRIIFDIKIKCNIITRDGIEGIKKR